MIKKYIYLKLIFFIFFIFKNMITCKKHLRKNHNIIWSGSNYLKYTNLTILNGWIKFWRFF